MRLSTASALLPILSLALTLPQQHASPRPLPLLIWHGLGDRYDADGLPSVGDLAEQVHPGTHVHYIRLDEDGGQDRTATFLGNLTEQLEQVCADILADPALRADPNDLDSPARVDALGFSQGGQFLRGLLQRCDGLRVRSLVTFGSQHNGVARVRACGAWDLVCKGALALLRGNVWSAYVQGRVVPAQYYRTLDDATGAPTAEYLAHSNFLADVNNERPAKNPAYRARLAALDRFVMFVFANDTTVIPRQTGWFAEVNMTSDRVTPLRETPAYREDWIGLKQLDEKGGLVFATHPGDHMQLEEEILTRTFEDYFGPESPLRHEGPQSLAGVEAGFRWSSGWLYRMWSMVWSRGRRPRSGCTTKHAKEFL